MTDEAPRSPCISVCVLNEKDVCIGCYRSSNEIVDWFMASPQRKREILSCAQERRDKAERIRLD